MQIKNNLSRSLIINLKKKTLRLAPYGKASISKSIVSKELEDIVEMGYASLEEKPKSESKKKGE